MESTADVLRGARALLARGVGMACITRGGAGAVLVTKDGAWSAQAPARSVTRPVGAGDAFLAGLLAALSRGAAPEDALRLAVASGTAWALAWPARRPTPAEVDDMARTVAPQPM
jgi:1-phosphofructokinase